MKNGPLLFIGLFAAFAISWAGFALGPTVQIGSVKPYFDVALDKAFPEAPTGIANRGRDVYRELGCIACHTQQVRREGYGADIERHWGARQSWSRDYLFEDPVQLGNMRVGPDLTTVGDRVTTEQAYYDLLYSGSGSMPGYPFLFGSPPPNAPKPANAVGGGLAPSYDAQALVAYLMDLKAPQDYPPEMANNKVSEEEAH